MADLQGQAGSGHENKAVTVLVVEDEVMMRTKLAEELQDAGYSVVEASDGTEAVDICGRSGYERLASRIIGRPRITTAVEAAR